MLRFTDIYSSQNSTYNPEAPYSPGDPFIAFEKVKDIKVNGNISKATEKAFDKEHLVIANRERIAEEYSRALDEATCRVQELGLGNGIGQLEKALAQVLERFARGDDLLRVGTDHTALSQSMHATPQGTAILPKISYAEVTKSHLHNASRANLPQKPCNPVSKHIPLFVKMTTEYLFAFPKPMQVGAIIFTLSKPPFAANLDLKETM